MGFLASVIFFGFFKLLTNRIRFHLPFIFQPFRPTHPVKKGSVIGICANSLEGSFSKLKKGSTLEVVQKL